MFHEGQLIAFCGSIAHHLDVGGGVAGLNASATEIYQEGIQLPPARFSTSVGTATRPLPSWNSSQ